jgi:cholesterol transport system auxiliary component
MHSPLQGKILIRALTLFALLLLGGCTIFQPAKSTSMSTYSIEVQLEAAGNGEGKQTIQVSTPGARPGYDTRRMVYTKRPHEIEFFTQNQWVDSPARMLTPLLVQALESSAKYRAVVTTRSAATADLRLDTEIIRLQHEFTTRPSQVHLTVRAQLTDIQGKRVIASREFNVTEASPSEDPYGGVLATNRAVKTLLQQITEFCAAESKAGNPRSARE